MELTRSSGRDEHPGTPITTDPFLWGRNVKKIPIVRLTAGAVVVALAAWLVLASAQEGEDKKGPKKDETTPVASRSHDESDPDLRSTSSVSFASDDRELRVVGISPQLKSSKNYVRGLRFHKLLGALAERDAPLEKGMPSVIDGIRRNVDGSAWLRFRVLVSTPEFLKRCRDAVLAAERELLKEEKLTQDDIRVEPWPLKHCVVSAQDSFSKEILGVSQTGTLTGTKQEFSFTMLFGRDDLAKVIDLIRKGELEFVYSYTYVGSTEYKGSVDLKGVKSASLVAGQKLSSEQVEGKEAIFQAEAASAVRHLMASVERTTRINHPELFAQLNQPSQFIGLFQKLFADDGQVTFKDLKDGDEKAATMLAAYLKPHLEQVREALGTEKSKVTIHEDKQKTGGEVQAGLGGVVPLPIPISLSFGGGLSSVKEVLDRIEEATGSKWGYEKTTEQYRPHSVKKLKFQKGADQVFIDEKTTVFLSVGKENRYLEETPIPVTFTTKSAKVTAVAVRSGDLGPYEGVPLGAVLPFFGATPPKGYVWLDGEARWPNAPWLPTHLRGTKVPDLRGKFVAGTTAEKAGLKVDAGKLALETKFKMPDLKVKTVGHNVRTFNALGEMDGGGGTLFTVNNPVMVRHNKGRVSASGVQQHSLHADWTVTQEMPVVATQGSLTLDALPAHVGCCWIVRIE